MYPILLLFGMIVFFTIDRFLYISKSKVDADKLMSLLKSQIVSGNIQGAIKVCSGNPTPLTRIVQAGLTKFNRPDAEVQAAMDEAALRELPKIESRTGYLAMLGNVATLVGLLGTILGLIHSFAGVAGVDPSMKATLLAKGISEAMNCTAFGLICAVPALLGFAILNGWTQGVLDDINEVSVQVVNLVVGHRNAMKGGQAS
jgi:biopolymer transport protein ExbB/TolQ